MPLTAVEAASAARQPAVESHLCRLRDAETGPAPLGALRGELVGALLPQPARRHAGGSHEGERGVVRLRAAVGKFGSPVWVGESY